ncbi:MAG: 5-formyltetrahydrofolate cyclo-ligase [Proteobacteria bacterium]|nr:5-formyltetrahydrofolate cyclo-ligase [Pseudomonadota bacterium]
MPSDHSSQKKLLRRGANSHGLDSAAERHRLDREMCDRFISAFPPDKSKVLSFFWPLAKECDTRPIAEAYHAAGAPCALPVIRTDARGLVFRSWSPDTPMAKSSFGTMQPTEKNPELVPDILLVPLVMIDLNGTRLGRGAGHYDATLGPLRKTKNILAIGVAYDWQVSEDALPREEHDERLDGLITPTRVILFP